MGGGGSKAIITGYTYWGSYACYLCLGPVKTLHRITNGDTEIWTGPIDSSSADADGKTVLNTTIGVINFYWGTFTQNPDALLSTLEIDRGAGPVLVPMPAFRGLCYYVCDDVAFGQQVTPPTLRFLYEKDSSGLSISSHNVTGDVPIPEAIYDLMANGMYGGGILPGDIDAASFAAAAETTITEGLVASPDIDSLEQARELIGRALGYIDGSIFFDGGKFKMKLNRSEDPTGLPTVTEADLLEEPNPDMDQFQETWSRTIVTFHDRDNKWEETGTDYEDPANAAMRGHKETRVLNYPWITRRDVADKLAAYQGIKHGLPSGFWRLVLKPGRTDLRCGSLFKLSYSKFGIANRICRVKRRTMGKPTAPQITLEVYEERQRDIANSYYPGGDYDIPGNTHDFTLTDTTPRLSWLPADLKSGAADGFLVAANRPASGSPTGGDIWWTWSPVDQPYQLLATFNSFPAKGTVVGWWNVRGTSWVLRVEFASEDYEWMQILKDEATELFAVIGVREYRTVVPVNVPDVLSPWMRVTPGGIFNLRTATQIDIEIDAAGWYGTDPISYEDGISNGRFPTEHIYFGRVDDFAIYPSDVINFERNAGNAIGDAALLRYVKVPVRNATDEQDVASVAAVTYDRDLPTMSPNGTYSRDWGAVIVSGDEAFDALAGPRSVDGTEGAGYINWADIDDALGAIYGGTATSDQTLLAQNIDDLLGQMVSSDQTFYHP